ncbi:MAG: IS110 family transposase [Proteobacteria bacterium]|nr:IS110 family transposase [Pseudomonadota bacterium]
MTIINVGMDVHARTITVAVAEPGRERARPAGRIATSGEAVDRLVERLRAEHGEELRFAQEAGPCGYWLHRQLEARGVRSIVAAPTLIARRPGERVKTDERDACKLAEQDRAGGLVAVWVGDAAQEAMRDLVRARGAAMRALRREKQQVASFMLRQGRHWPRATWTQAHRAWLAEQRFDAAAQSWVMEEMLAGVALAEARVARVTSEIAAQVEGWAMAPVVAALQSLRGIGLINAAVLAAELGDLRRFATARGVMAFLGLVAREASSGERVWRGELTKTGNRRARTTLIEAAWCYRWPASSSGVALARRRAAQPPAINAIAVKAEQRLCQRFARLARRKKPGVAVAAVARELAGFVWAIGQLVAPTPAR